MRGNQLQFSQFQKLRLQKALDKLESLSSDSSVLWSVLTSTYVFVRSLLSRYKPKAGDIVIGRVIEVGQNRWRLDINCGQNAYMMLSAMNMPDGLQPCPYFVVETNTEDAETKGRIEKTVLKILEESNMHEATESKVRK
uniref:Nucleic acid-binding, OB-fold n=1 Tax=Medicago truncatula TaxID=3880 RepID=A2Q2I9_MEDTR|nr:Nucleic acid-binding, OB-fold [Medicago truncatula]